MKRWLYLVFILMTGCFAGHARQVVDVHSHNILPDYRAVLARHHAELEEGFPLPAWDVDSHLSFMDSAGIACTVLSMPAPQPSFGDSEECRQVIRACNEYGARLKAAYPDRFRFCAALPLPDVESAVAEAIYALDTLGADGVKLATNSRGQYLGDEALDPLMEVLDSRQAVILVHPHKPVPVNESLIGRLPLAAYEYPAETTRAVVNMISRNVLARNPNVKVIVPHCGSFLPMAIPRMKAVHPAMLAKGFMGQIDWENNLSRLYYDLAGGASPEIVKMMLTVTTPEHILYGSDYPYMPDNVLQGNLTRMREQFAADKELAPYAERFFSENARDLYNR